MKRHTGRAGVALLLLLLSPASGRGQEGEASGSARVGIEPRAREILQSMSDFLGELEAFSFRTRQLTDELGLDDQKIQMSRRGEVLVQRPNRFRVRFTADDEIHSYWYDGGRFTMYEANENVFAQSDAPATLDETLDFVARTFGLHMPLADLIYASAYDALITDQTRGRYLGLHDVEDTRCHHLAFRQPGLDWQIWIESGDRPLPRKMVITTTRTTGHPQVIGYLDRFEIAPELAADSFEFKPPAGSKRLPFDGQGRAD